MTILNTAPEGCIVVVYDVEAGVVEDGMEVVVFWLSVVVVSRIDIVIS